MSSMKKFAVSGAFGALVAMQGCGSTEQKTELETTVKNVEESLDSTIEKITDAVQETVEQAAKVVENIDADQLINEVKNAVDGVTKQAEATIKDVVEAVSEQTPEDALKVLETYKGLNFSSVKEDGKYVCRVANKEEDCTSVFTAVVKALRTLNEAKAMEELPEKTLEALQKFSDSVPGARFYTNWNVFSIAKADEMKKYAAEEKKGKKEGEVAYPNMTKVYNYLPAYVESVKCAGVKSASKEICSKSAEFLEAVAGLKLTEDAFTSYGDRMRLFIKAQASQLSLPLPNSNFDDSGKPVSKEAPAKAESQSLRKASSKSKQEKLQPDA